MALVRRDIMLGQERRELRLDQLSRTRHVKLLHRAQALGKLGKNLLLNHPHLSNKNQGYSKMIKKATALHAQALLSTVAAPPPP